jgi:hypothetical protein
VEIDEAFWTSGRRELASLEPAGFGGLVEQSGAGFRSLTVFRGVAFVHLVREVRDQLVYCELGFLVDGRMPGWRSGERTDLRELVDARPGLDQTPLGVYEETASGLVASVGRVGAAIRAFGIGFLNDRAPSPT